jgi:hypothetical protein
LRRTLSTTVLVASSRRPLIISPQLRH